MEREKSLLQHKAHFYRICDVIGNLLCLTWICDFFIPLNIHSKNAQFVKGLGCSILNLLCLIPANLLIRLLISIWAPNLHQC